MPRYLVLIEETDKGLAVIKDSPNRAAQFKALAAEKGVTVEAQLWMFGDYDGALVLSAPTEEAVLGLVLHLDSLGYVHAHVSRAYDETEFRALVSKL